MITRFSVIVHFVLELSSFGNLDSRLPKLKTFRHEFTLTFLDRWRN